MPDETRALQFPHVLVRESREAILIVDADDSILLANPAAGRSLGCDPDALAGLKLADLIEDAGDGRVRILRRDGGQGAGELRTSAAAWQGRPVTLALLWDTTEIEAAGQRLNALTSALRASNTSLEQYAYVVSHDLREPLRMISGHLGVIAEEIGDDADPQLRRSLGFARDGAQRMNEMIVGLLELARLDAGIEFVPTDLNRLAAEVLDDMALSIRESGARVSVAELPELPVDPVQIRELLQNLLSNAIKFCGDETPRVKISAARDGDAWRFSVADNGIGIEPRNFDRAFKVFQRLHTSEQYEGTGLGLSTAQKIVERHGGRIWLESEPGRGSVFHFTLPVQQQVLA